MCPSYDGGLPARVCLVSSPASHTRGCPAPAAADRGRVGMATSGGGEALWNFTFSGVSASLPYGPGKIRGVCSFAELVFIKAELLSEVITWHHTDDVTVTLK